MDATQGLLLIAVPWVAIGVTAGIVMGRREHNPFTWLILGTVLGPLCVPVAMVAVFKERSHIRREVIEGRGGEGPVDILVGIDGSPESRAALLRVGTLFGTQIGRLALACVEDFDTAESGFSVPNEERTTRSLERTALDVAAWNPSAVMLSGRPAEALIRYAADEGDELVAIGRRGHGARNAAIASTAARLARGSAVPVLIM